MLFSFLWPTQTIDDLHLLPLPPPCAYDVHALLFSHQARVDATVSLSFVSPILSLLQIQRPLYQTSVPSASRADAPALN